MGDRIAALALFATIIVATFGFAFVTESVEAVEKPWLEVKPNYYMTSTMEKFNVSVWLNDIEAADRCIGVEFRLIYNATLLEVVNVEEGPFMKDPAWAPFGTFFVFSVEEPNTYPKHVLAGDLIMPNGTGFWNPPFPDGSGEIAKITFRGINDKGTCLLNLTETKCIGVDLDGKTGVLIDLGEPRDGYYDIWPLLCDVNRKNGVNIIDVALVAKAFGSVPGDPRWDPRYNLVLNEHNANKDRNGPNEIIDIRDIALFRFEFGKKVP